MTLTASSAIHVGDVMRDVTLRDLNGQLLSTGAYRGRPLLIFMWATW